MTDTQPARTAASAGDILAILKRLAGEAAQKLNLAPAACSDQWAYSSGEHVVSWAWLVPLDDENMINQGFRFRRVGSRQHLEIWGKGTKLDLSGENVMGFPGIEGIVLTAVTSRLDKRM
jgi:hypothetical protein